MVDLRVTLPVTLRTELDRRAPPGGAGAFARGLLREQLDAHNGRRPDSLARAQGEEFRFKVHARTRRELKVRAARLGVTLSALCALLLQTGLDAEAGRAPNFARGASALPGA